MDEVDRHILRKYELDNKLGKGAYGIVWKAVDKKSKETVALKKIFDAFQNATDAQRTYREVHFLLKMRGHPNIITLQHVLKADNDRDLYLTFEYMDTDLNAAVKANILEDVHKQYIMFQCFDALQFMHACDLVHRDMKPANLLLNSMCLMKVCDFGLARSVSDWAEGSDTREAIMTDYVATRWYRAPEILVASSAYDYAVDMWSMGCILAECLQGKPIFTGVTTMNQLEKIIDLIGWPSDSDMESWRCTHAAAFLDACSPAIKQDDRRTLTEDVLRHNLHKELPTASGDAISLLMALLCYDTRKRAKPREAQKMAYCSSGPWVELPPPTRAPKKEPVTRDLITSDSKRLTTNIYREGIYTIMKDQFGSNKASQESNRSAAPSRREARESHRASYHNNKAGDYRSGNDYRGGGDYRSQDRTGHEKGHEKAIKEHSSSNGHANGNANGHANGHSGNGLASVKEVGAVA